MVSCVCTYSLYIDIYRQYLQEYVEQVLHVIEHFEQLVGETHET